MIKKLLIIFSNICTAYELANELCNQEIIELLQKKTNEINKS